MINRLLIRIKTIQLVYACLQSHEQALYVDEQLMASLEASQKLYNYLLALIVKVTDHRASQLEAAKGKYFATEEELHPNTRLADNRIAALIREHSEVIDYCEKQHLTSDFDTELYRSILEQLEQSALYQQYMTQAEEPTFEQDRELWIEVLNNIVPQNEHLDEVLEERDIYWNDDLTTVLQSVIRTVKGLKPNTEMIPTAKTFTKEADRQFALNLFHHCLEDYHDNVKLINKVAPNWEAERMALMDKVIMSCALSEIKHFTDIAVAISINEYIELAKHYCSANSARFINGILDRIVKTWREEKVIIKV